MPLSNYITHGDIYDAIQDKVIGDSIWSYWEFRDVVSLIPELSDNKLMVKKVWHENDYQGDEFALLKRKYYNEWYFIPWSFGSCSGCDVIQASHGNRVEELRIIREMIRGAREFHNLDELKMWLDDNETVYSWDSFRKGFRESLENVK